MASQINIKAKLMDEAEIRYEKELEELACKNAKRCSVETEEKRKKEEEMAKMMLQLKNEETVREKQLLALHQQSFLIPALKRKMNECCVAEFQRHQIEENVIKKKENRSRKCAEKCIGSLELQEKSMEEMRVAECIKQEAHKKALLNQIKENIEIKQKENSENLKLELRLRDINMKEIQKEKQKQEEKKWLLNRSMLELQKNSYEWLQERKRQERMELLAGQNKNLADLFKPRKLYANCEREELKDRLREKIEEIEKEKRATEVARIEYSFLNDEDIRRMGSYKKMDQRNIEAEKMQNKKDMIEMQKRKQMERDRQREHENQIEELHKQNVEKEKEKERQKKREKEEKSKKYRQDVFQQALQTYNFKMAERQEDLDRHRESWKVYEEFLRNEKKEMDRLSKKLAFNSQYGLSCSKACFSGKK